MSSIELLLSRVMLPVKLSLAVTMLIDLPGPYCRTCFASERLRRLVAKRLSLNCREDLSKQMSLLVVTVVPPAKIRGWLVILDIRERTCFEALLICRRLWRVLYMTSDLLVLILTFSG